MGESESFFNQLPLWKFPWEQPNQIEDIDQLKNRKDLPWQCPVCLMRFKWDISLLRHERKTGHQNPHRKQRQQNRYKKEKTKAVNCTLCELTFENSIKRLQHKRWCPNDPKTERTRYLYKSSFQEYAYQCYSHDEPWYFRSLQQLQLHIKSHKNIGGYKIQKVKDIFVWKKKQGRVGLSNKEYQQISQKLEVRASLSTLRRMFKKS